MSIRFPDLQVLLPRANSTSQMEQQNQRQVDVAQAQLAAETIAETEAKRRQISRSQETNQERIRERERHKDEGFTQSSEASEPRKPGASRRERPDGACDQLGQSIDIRV